MSMSIFSFCNIARDMYISPSVMLLPSLDSSMAINGTSKELGINIKRNYINVSLFMHLTIDVYTSNLEAFNISNSVYLC